MRTPLVNDGRHLYKIITTTICNKHQATEGMACFEIYPGNRTSTSVLSGVCGGRVKKAGYTGKINPLSLRLRTPGGRSGAPKP